MKILSIMSAMSLLFFLSSEHVFAMTRKQQSRKRVLLHVSEEQPKVKKRRLAHEVEVDIWKMLANIY